MLKQPPVVDEHEMLISLRSVSTTLDNLMNLIEDNRDLWGDYVDLYNVHGVVNRYIKHLEKRKMNADVAALDRINDIIKYAEDMAQEDSTTVSHIKAALARTKND